LELASDDPQQRGLARAVGAHERDLRTLPDAERHVIEQHPAVRQLIPDSLDVDVTHEDRFSHRFVCGFAWLSPLPYADESHGQGITRWLPYTGSLGTRRAWLRSRCAVRRALSPGDIFAATMPAKRGAANDVPLHRA